MFFVRMASFCAGMLLIAAAAISGAADPPRIVKNAELQKQIDRTVQAFSNTDHEIGIPEAFAELGKLHVIKVRQEEELLKQLVYYIAHAHSDDAEYAIVVFHLCRFSHGDIVGVLVRYLDAEDPKVVSAVLSVLRIVENRRASECPPDYSHYLGYLQGHKGNPPLGLVAHMYRMDPEEALRALMAVYMLVEATEDVWRRVAVVRRTLHERGEDGKISPEAKREAVEQLDALARHDGWWVRLYVPAIIRHQIGFHPSEILKLLARDKHVLVKRAALDVLNERAAKELPPAPPEDRPRINELKTPKK